MSDSSIQFFIEDLPSFSFNTKAKTSHWLHQVFLKEDKILQSLNIVFCSDAFLLNINQAHLKHDYYTDIITFPLNDSGEAIEADIFISVERVQENAQTLKQIFQDELARVMVHGVLHLVGYNDATTEEKTAMRKLESAYLELI